MSARSVMRLVLLVQALAALGIGIVAVQVFGIDGWLAAAIGLASVVLVRLAINANNFALSARAGSPTPPAFRLTPPAFVRMVGTEFRTSMLLTSWHIPRACARLRIHQRSAPLPVVLIHGYGCNSGYWSTLAARLDAAGISHATLDLEPLTGDIDGYAARIEDAIAALCGATGAQQVTIVAHSMGGLAARAWIRAHGTTRLARLVTLGTPHHGTCLAAFGVGINAGQMRRAGVAGPACAWIEALADGEDAATRARITSIYSHHDNIIAPQTSSVLPGARNLAFGGVGHVALGHDARVLAAVQAEIDAAQEMPGAAVAVQHRS